MITPFITACVWFVGFGLATAGAFAFSPRLGFIMAGLIIVYSILNPRRD